MNDFNENILEPLLRSGQIFSLNRLQWLEKQLSECSESLTALRADRDRVERERVRAGTDRLWDPNLDSLKKRISSREKSLAEITDEAVQIQQKLQSDLEKRLVVDGPQPKTTSTPGPGTSRRHKEKYDNDNPPQPMDAIMDFLDNACGLLQMYAAHYKALSEAAAEDLAIFEGHFTEIIASSSNVKQTMANLSVDLTDSTRAFVDGSSPITGRKMTACNLIQLAQNVQNQVMVFGMETNDGLGGLEEIRQQKINLRDTLFSLHEKFSLAADSVYPLGVEYCRLEFHHQEQETFLRSRIQEHSRTLSHPNRNSKYAGGKYL